VFLFFTGSDWCGWCKRLEEEILTTSEFKNYAKEKLILVKLDFSSQIEQSEALQNQNRTLGRPVWNQGVSDGNRPGPSGQGREAARGTRRVGPGRFVQRPQRAVGNPGGSRRGRDSNGAAGSPSGLAHRRLSQAPRAVSSLRNSTGLCSHSPSATATGPEGWIGYRARTQGARLHRGATAV